MLVYPPSLRYAGNLNGGWPQQFSTTNNVLMIDIFRKAGLLFNPINMDIFHRESVAMEMYLSCCLFLKVCSRRYLEITNDFRAIHESPLRYHSKQ